MSFLNNLVHILRRTCVDRENTCGTFLTNSFSRGSRRRKRRRRRRRLENPQERNNGRLFRKLFSAGCRETARLSLSLSLSVCLSLFHGRGDERTGVKKKAKIGVQTKSERKDGKREEEKEEEDMEDEEVEGHCDCLALTFASHILPGCQWHSTGEFSIATSDFCSRTETRYLI